MVRKKKPHKIGLGRRGGRKAGLSRAARLTPERREEIAREAVLTGWAKAENLNYPSVEIGSSKVSQPIRRAAAAVNPRASWDRQPVEKLATAQGVRPLRDAKDLIAAIWKSDDELAAFLKETYSARRH